jgi:uncharacterized membrane protein YhaH (DUF805 family)
MQMVDAVKACFANYADFNGRATRSEYWWFFLAVLLGSATASLIAPRFYALFALVTLLPMIAVGARRLHDTDRSGWWQLLALAPFGVILVINLLGTKEQRRTTVILGSTSPFLGRRHHLRLSKDETRAVAKVIIHAGQQTSEAKNVR